MSRWYVAGTPSTYGRPTKWAFIDPIAALFVLFLLFSTIKVVGVGEVGVVTRFGNVNRQWSSGLHLKAPWPFEKVDYFDIKVQKDQANSAASTSDLQDVTTTLAVNYNLSPDQVGRVYREVGVDFKSRIIDPAIQEAFKSVSAEYTAQELLTKRPEVKAKVVDKLSSRLSTRGITLDDVSIVNFQFSKEFTAAIESKQVAQQQAQQAQFRLEQAQKDAQAQEAQKTSLSAELLQKYAIDKWDGHLPTYLGSGTVFNIPLQK